MKKFNAFSFYYTLVVVSIIVFGSVLTLPDPFNMILPLALAPSFLYLWLNVTNPQSASESSWSYRVMLVIVILMGLGLFGYLSAPKLINNQDDPVITSNEEQKIDELNTQIGELKDQISGLKNDDDTSTKEDESETLGDKDNKDQITDLIKYLETKESTNSANPNTASLTAAGYVRVSTKTEIDVYSTNNETARIVGIASLGNKYPFYESKGGWYMIEFDANKKGWVKAQDVTEVN